jgi:cobalt/nickel transport system ATP-binding protein
MGMNDKLLHLRGIEFSYLHGTPVLRGLDLELGTGERVGVTGSNGSGKTTLLHLIVGLLRPDKGEITAFGRPRRSEDDFWEVRTRAGLLFQDAEDQLFSPTVIEDVAFGPLNLGKSRREAMRIASDKLAEVGLPGFEDRITYRLSSGEKRLVSLASVLAMEPEVLLLDEPTSGLDDQAVERVTRILNALPQAMIVISHARDFLHHVASRWLRLDNGILKPVGF